MCIWVVIHTNPIHMRMMHHSTNKCALSSKQYYFKTKMIGHDDLRGAINQIPNIWDEWEREEPLDLDWVVAIQSPTCRRKWVIRSESFPSFYFRFLCSFVRGFAYLKQPMLSLKESIFLCNQIVVRFSPEEKTKYLSLIL